MEGDRYAAVIKPLMSEKRYRHSLCVAQQAMLLARRVGVDPEKAYTAGILHDVMKDCDPSYQLQIMEQSGIILESVESKIGKIWHAKAGAAYVRDVLHIQDQEIIDAIVCHTTGKAGMTLFDQVLFLADFTSEDRDYDGAQEIRQALQEDFHGAMVTALSFSITDLVERGKLIHPDTVNAYNDTLMAEMS